MTKAEIHPVRRPSAARQRILDAADRLFYRHGVQAVGVEWIVAEAQVTRVTFYRHFPSKELLVEAYLRARGERARAGVGELVAAHPGNPRAVLDAIGRGLEDECFIDGFRGCEFINAAAEYSDESAAARRLAVEQRAWIVTVTAELLTELGRPHPLELARVLLMLRTGAFYAAGLDRTAAAFALFLQAWDALIDGSVELAGPEASPAAG